MDEETVFVNQVQSRKGLGKSTTTMYQNVFVCLLLQQSDFG